MKLFLLLSSLILSASSVFACNINEFLNSSKGQSFLEEMDAKTKEMVSNKLTGMGMAKNEFSIESKIPKSFISINPNGKYQWYKLNVNLPKDLKNYYSGIIISKESKKSYDQFDRVTKEVCGAEITFDAGVIVNKKSFKMTGEELVRFPSVRRFIPLN